MADSRTDSKASFAAISNGIVGSTVSTMDAVLTDANPDSYAIVTTMLGDHGRPHDLQEHPERRTRPPERGCRLPPAGAVEQLSTRVRMNHQ